jgi:prepilin-type N-terminal cleavage/methylation domain-containing protein
MAGCNLRRETGFSLVEVLVALTILSVGLLALLIFQVTAIKGNAVASKWTVATGLCQDRLERFRHVGWAGIVSSNSLGFDTATMTPRYANLPGAAGDNAIVRGTTYYRVWSVTDTTPTLKTINVWCCWRDERQNWHNVTLVTQRANVGGM